MTRSRLTVELCIAVVLTLALVGCGGGGGGAPRGAAATLAVTIKWPTAQPAAVLPSEIPVATKCIEAKASNGTTWLANAAVVRPLSATTSTLTFSDVPPGPVHFHFGAYSDYTTDATNTVSSSGNMLAWATVDVTVAAGETRQVNATLGTAPTRIAITAPAGQFSVLKGNVLPLTATAYDAENNVLLIPSVLWTAISNSVAVDQTGHVAANAPGTGVVTASVAGITGSATVTVAIATTVLDVNGTTQPGQAQDFIIGPSTTTRAYVADVTPTQPGATGAVIGRHAILPVWNGSQWNDVVRISNPSGAPALGVNVKVYDVSTLPTGGANWTLPSFGDGAGFGLAGALLQHGFVPMVTPTSPPPSGFAMLDVLQVPEFNGTMWIQVLRLVASFGYVAGNVRGYDAESLPLALDASTTLAPGQMRVFPLGPSVKDRAYVPAVSPVDLVPWVGFATLEVVPRFDGTQWIDVLRVATDVSSPSLSANVRAFAVDTAPATVATVGIRPKAP